MRATTASTGIEALVADLRNMDTSEKGTFTFTAHEDQFQYPLGIGLCMILLALATGDRRHRRKMMEAA